MIINNSLIALARNYLTRLKWGYITYEQFLNRIYTLIDLIEYSNNEVEYYRVKLLNIKLKGAKYRKLTHYNRRNGRGALLSRVYASIEKATLTGASPVASLTFKVKNNNIKEGLKV